jgi:hypothetical protein
LRVNCEMVSLYRAERTFSEQETEGERVNFLPSKCPIISRRVAHSVEGVLVDKRPATASILALSRGARARWKNFPRSRVFMYDAALVLVHDAVAFAFFHN